MLKIYRITKSIFLLDFIEVYGRETELAETVFSPKTIGLERSEHQSFSDLDCFQDQIHSSIWFNCTSKSV